MEVSSHIIKSEIRSQNEPIYNQAIELQKRVEELDNLVYRFSHDFKGPLDSIKGLLQIFPKDQLDENAQKYLELIAQSTHRLSNVVLDMIDGVSVIKSEPTYQPISLAALVTDAIATVKGYIPDNHKVDIQIDLNNCPCFNGDIQLIQSIIQHLMVNSILYHNPEAELPYAKLTISSKSDAIRILVEDNGQGISSEIQARIFDMFYRGSVRSRGTGLGLYVVKNAVEKLGGSLSMESELGKGTRFEIWIPCSE